VLGTGKKRNLQGAMLAGSTNPEKTYMEKIRPTKLKLQLKYVNERNIWIDCKIFFLTIKTIVTR
jgi:lipopolysaccharide/colanic/teichoic acid biosynthesis glycosyltransferase